MPIFVDKISSDRIAEQKLEIAALKSQLEIQAGLTNSPEIKKQNEPEPVPVETPKDKPQVKPAPAPAPKPEPVSALDAKRSELEKDHRVLSLIYASLPAGAKRIEARKEIKLLDSRIKALG